MSGVVLATGLVRSAPTSAWRCIATVHPGILFVALYAIALAAGLVVGVAVGYATAPGKLDFDEQEYWQLSSQLLDGSFAIFPRRTVAYPLILAAIRLVSPSFLVTQMLVTAIFALAAPMLFLLVRRLSGSTKTGVLAGLLFAVWPPTTYFGASLYSETAALPFFLLGLWLIPPGDRVTGQPTPTGGRAALGAGIVLALTTQIRSMYLLFIPFALLAILVEERRRWVAAARALLLLAGFAASTLPWSAYMTLRFHHLILVTANGGETLAGGLGPRLLQPGAPDRLTLPDRSTWVGPGKWLPLTQNGYLSASERRTLPYDRQDALLQQRAIAWARARPGDALYLELCKLGYMWGFYRMADNGTGQLLLGSLPIIVLLLAVLVALARQPRLTWQTPRLWIVPLFVSAVALISWGSWRFRQPADAALVGLAVISWTRRRDGARPAAPVRPDERAV